MKITDGKQDTGEMIIAMLTKANEIQKLAPYAFGDDGRFRFVRCEDNVYVRVGGHCNDEGFFEGAKRIWMPNQYQYQYMLGMSLCLLTEVIDSCYTGIIDYCWGSSDWKPESMDQLLCYMVMVSNHKKIWNGREFVKEE